MGFFAKFIAAFKGERLRHRVLYDEQRVIFTPADGKQQAVRWDELREVGVLTTDGGPAVDDVHWVLVTQSGDGFSIPSESYGFADLLSRLQQLPGFDNKAVAEAMGCSVDAKFVCWRANVR